MRVSCGRPVPTRGIRSAEETRGPKVKPFTLDPSDPSANRPRCHNDHSITVPCTAEGPNGSRRAAGLKTVQKVLTDETRDQMCVVSASRPPR